MGLDTAPDKEQPAKKKKETSTIFDIDKKVESEKKVGLEKNLATLKKAIKKVKEEEGQTEEAKSLITNIKDHATKSQNQTSLDIYMEVAFDEINQELMRSIDESKTDIVVVLMR